MKSEGFNDRRELLMKSEGFNDRRELIMVPELDEG